MLSIIYLRMSDLVKKWPPPRSGGTRVPRDPQNMGFASHRTVAPWFKKWPLGKVKVAPFLEFDQKWPLLRRWRLDSENIRVCGTSKLADLIKKWPLR